MDRAELILDIFATRARSSEAKMQVELAQLEYMLPRLTRMWTHLEKFRGGIGVRGPGETQLETDRRLINHRIKLLKERLRARAAEPRACSGRAARSAFKASLVGYTNAGKSSILRGMTGATTCYVEDRLFATLDPLTREVDLGENAQVLLTDTVGFIRKLPHHLVASFRATLEETRDADLLLHVVDASHPLWEEQRMVVDQVLAELGHHRAAGAARVQQDGPARGGRGARAAGARHGAGAERGVRVAPRPSTGSIRCAARCATPCARGGPSPRCGSPARRASCWRRSTSTARCWSSAARASRW